MPSIEEIEKAYPRSLDQMREREQRFKERHGLVKKKSEPVTYDYEKDHLLESIKSGDVNLGKQIFYEVYSETLNSRPEIKHENKAGLHAMFMHFSRIKYLKEENHDRKGFFVWGKNGSGKSKVMKSMCVFSQPLSNPIVTWKSYSNILKGYMVRGESVILGLSQPELIIDDLGFNNKGTGKRFGNAVDLVSDIVEHRHRLWEKHGYVTHYTSNFSEKQLLESYSKGIVGRLFQMCYNVKWIGEDYRVKENIK